MQFQLANAGRDIDARLPLQRQGLKRHAALRSADQHIGTEARGDRCLSCGPDIRAGKHSGSAIGISEHRPDDHTAARKSNVEADSGYGASIALLWLTRLAAENAIDVLLRTDDQADARRHRASQLATNTSFMSAGAYGSRCRVQSSQIVGRKHENVRLHTVTWDLSKLNGASRSPNKLG
jgi:hypothetical protein